MAPPAKAAKGVKSNDLRMFFGPGGSQPKPIPAAVSEARLYHSHSPSQPILWITEEERTQSRWKEVCWITRRLIHLKPGTIGDRQIPHLCPWIRPFYHVPCCWHSERRKGATVIEDSDDEPLAPQKKSSPIVKPKKSTTIISSDEGITFKGT